MNKTFILFFIITTYSFAQPIVKNLNPFKSISINAAMDVELVPSSENKLEILTADIDKLFIKNTNEELVLDLPLLDKFSKAIAVKIYFQPGIRYLSAANNANVYTTVAINESFFEVKAIHNAKLNLVLNTNNFKADLNLGAVVTLAGFTEFQQISAMNKTTFDAFNFKSKKTIIKCNSSNAAIYVTDYLDATAKFKSDIVYAGEPVFVEQNTFLSNVHPKNN